MRAAVFYEPNHPLRIEDVPRPDNGYDELLIEVKACGICHTDFSMYKGSYFPRKTPPVIFGHEIAGVVIKTGKSTTDYKVRDRVVILPNISCGECKFCREGYTNLCDNLKTLGIDTNGGFAEYVCVPESNVFKLPDFLSFEEGALLCDSIATPFHALKKAGIESGALVAVFGIGGLGMNAIKLLNTIYASDVIAVDIIPEKLKKAKNFGAKEIINSSQKNVVDCIKKLTGGRGVDYSFEFVGKSITYNQAIKCTRKGGKVVCIGAGNFNLNIDTARLFKEELTITGAYGTPRKEFVEMVELVENKVIDITDFPVFQIKLDEINNGFDIIENQENFPLRIVVGI